jgi:hypothetical protein
MKTVIALLLLTISAAAAPQRILFIGNSYTGVNNPPSIFSQIVASDGRPIPVIEAVTPGGRTLEQHSKLPETLAKIDKGNWDIVVVQGQSQEAAMAEVAGNMRASFTKGAETLFARIKAKSPQRQDRSLRDVGAARRLLEGPEGRPPRRTRPRRHSPALEGQFASCV